MTADSDTIYCKCEGHRVPYAECAEPLCGKLRAEFKEATDTSPDRIEAVGRAIFGAVTSANPDAFHPAYERDRKVWDDAAKSAIDVKERSPMPDPTNAELLRAAILAEMEWNFDRTPERRKAADEAQARVLERMREPVGTAGP